MTTDDQAREADRATLERWRKELERGSAVVQVTVSEKFLLSVVNAALSAATEGNAPPPTDERVQLLERLLGHEAGLICAWAREPTKYAVKLKAWAEVLERRVPDAPPPEPKPDATGGEAEDCCLTCGATLQEEQRDYCSPECAPAPEAARTDRCPRSNGPNLVVVGCDGCGGYHVADAALATATAELEWVRADEAWWKRQRDDALAANERAKNGFAKERATLRAKLEEAERDRDIARSDDAATARTAAREMARADDLAKRLEEAERKAAGLQREHDLTARVATEQRARADAAEKELAAVRGVEAGLRNELKKANGAELRASREATEQRERADAAEAKAKEAERERDAYAALVAEARDQRDKAVFAQRRAERRIAEAVAYCEGFRRDDGGVGGTAGEVLRILTPAVTEVEG